MLRHFPGQAKVPGKEEVKVQPTVIELYTCEKNLQQTFCKLTSIYDFTEGDHENNRKRTVYRKIWQKGI